MIIRPYVLAWWTLLGIYGCAALLALPSRPATGLAQVVG